MATHIIYESPIGYALFEVKLVEELGARSKQVQDAIFNISSFGSMVELKSFVPFKDAAHALENANDISEGVLNDHLEALLELALPSKRKGVVVGVSERGLAGAIKLSLGVECDTSERTLELIRGVRLHAERLITGLQPGDIVRSQLGLGHAYSRAKVKFNVNRSDNMIIQAIALLDQLDKDVNTFAMRVREWYGWHFPELVKIVPDNLQYTLVVQLVGDKSKLLAKGDADDDFVGKISDILEGDEPRARNVIDAVKTSMGTDISPIDLINIANFAQRVIHLFNYRKSLQAYLTEKMGLVAPNLGALIGDTIAARLISHAGSLTNLSKYPASTVQILGAEKALFRALKTKGNTPKYGLIFHSTFIGRAGQKNKGRISRFLANKCSIASRIDCFSDAPTNKFGEALRGQVEERLAFYETGSAPTKNSEAMARVLKVMRAEDGPAVVVRDEDGEAVAGEVALTSKSKKKKRKSGAMDVDSDVAPLVKKHKSKVADTPSAPLSAAQPLGAMSIDADGLAPTRKKKKSKAAAAIVDSTPAVASSDTTRAPPSASSALASAAGSPKKKKKKDKNVAMDG